LEASRVEARVKVVANMVIKAEVVVANKFIKAEVTVAMNLTQPFH
jgi:hypothetical protein